MSCLCFEAQLKCRLLSETLLYPLLWQMPPLLLLQGRIRGGTDAGRDLSVMCPGMELKDGLWSLHWSFVPECLHLSFSCYKNFEQCKPITRTPTVLVHSGCYRKILEIGWITSNRNLFLIVLELGSLRSGWQRGWARALFWGTDFSRHPPLSNRALWSLI